MVSKHPEIVLASGNQGKIKEFKAMLTDYTIIPQGQFQIKEIEETGTTFVENAILKARNAVFHSKFPAIADDSGLVVDALGGAPGVISARYAGNSASDNDNILKLLDAVRNIPEQQRSARFICVLVFMEHLNDPCPIITQGIWKGRIILQPTGKNGFGYDSVFWVNEYNCTSAQLSREIKNTLSHRGIALKSLVQQIKAKYSE